MAIKKIKINRAPVLTLWAAIVAERLGYDRKESLTFGKAVAGLNAQSKGRRLGIYEEKKDSGRRKIKRRKNKRNWNSSKYLEGVFQPSEHHKVCAPRSKVSRSMRRLFKNT